MTRRLDPDALPSILCNGIIINLSSSVKELGLFIDINLSWQTQVSSLSQKVTGILRALYQLKNFLLPETKTMLVQTLILPIFNYGYVCCDLNAICLNKYDRLRNNCIWFVFNLRKYDYISSFRHKLNWLPIHQRHHLRALSTLYSILNSPN